MQLIIENYEENRIAKPFLKWAGGKQQLIKEILKRFPKEMIKSKQIRSYVEPFIGGGALFFHLESYFDVKESVICDINPELIIGYNVVKKNVEDLIRKLQILEKRYLSKDTDSRKKMYYEIRQIYNDGVESFDYYNYNQDWIKRASLLIFLNKTCFNGLFRLNSKGHFNVPQGSYKNPTICHEDNLISCSKALSNTTILLGEFEKTEQFINENSIVYYDPPYRPLNKTSSFNSYAKDGFNDEDQIRLADYFKRIHNKSLLQILSNSDPKNVDMNDNFFDKLYENFSIDRIYATRAINSKASKRGNITELLITDK